VEVISNVIAERIAVRSIASLDEIMWFTDLASHTQSGNDCEGNDKEADDKQQPSTS